jgi:hypothetical protein
MTVNQWMRVTTLCASIAIVPVAARAQSDAPAAPSAPPTRPFHLIEPAASLLTEPAASPLTEPAPAVRPLRLAALMPLYGTLIGLQALDLDSTMKAMASRTGREANPVMYSLVGRPAAVVAVKAAATGAIVFGSERLRRTHHPVAAVMLMIGINSTYAMVVAHNYAVVNRAR